MPKVRRSRVKLHDSAPASGRLASAPATSSRLFLSTTGNGGGESRSPGVRKCDALSFRCGVSSTQIHAGPGKPAASNHGCREVHDVSTAAGTDQLGVTGEVTITTKCLSRGQRRRAEKRDAWLRKFDFPKYAQKLREEQRRLQEGENLQESPLTEFTSALRQQLHDCDAHKDAGKSVTGLAAAGGRKRVTRRCIQHLAEKEIAQYSAVLAFPAFRASPLAVLKEHLRNTTCAQQKTSENV